MPKCTYASKYQVITNINRNNSAISVLLKNDRRSRRGVPIAQISVHLMITSLYSYEQEGIEIGDKNVRALS